MDATLLYIDPSPALRLLVQRALEAEPFAVHQAASAPDGQHAAARLRPDLILVDVDRVRAAELIPALRGLPGLERVRLIAATADARPEHTEKMLAWGFDRVWLHPLDIDALAVEFRLALQPLPEAPAGIEAQPPPSALATGAPLLPPLAPVEVPVLWELALTPLLAQLARSTASAEGVLALLDEAAGSLTVVAAIGGRRAGGERAAGAAPAAGERVRAGSAPWIEPALRAGEALTIPLDAIAPSALVPAGSQVLLVVPVATRERIRGVAVLGKPGAGKGPAFAVGKVARSLIHAQQIAGIVEMLESLDRAVGERRREIEELRGRCARAVLSEVSALAGPSRGNGAEPGACEDEADGTADPVVRLGLRVADHLGLPPRPRETLRRALEVRDVGRAWVEQVLFARATFSVGGRERLLETAALHGAEILSGLDWPADVVDLIRALGAADEAESPADGEAADPPIEARVLGVVSAYGWLVADRLGEDPETGQAVAQALAELSREGGHRYDPAVAEALLGLVASGAAAGEEPR